MLKLGNFCRKNTINTTNLTNLRNSIKMSFSTALKTDKLSIDFTGSYDTPKEWVEKEPLHKYRQEIISQGFTVINDIINNDLVKLYQTMYDKLLYNEDNIDATKHRHDLGSNESQHLNDFENVTQIMWPSEYINNLLYSPFYSRSKLIAQYIFGKDIEFDFDMIIYKHPQSNTEVPWHQDEGYWPKGMTDKRALSFWLALDNATIDNGCMWFNPINYNNNIIYNHIPAVEGSHVIKINDNRFNDLNGKCIEINSGSCTVHHGQTPHRTLGNSTDDCRRALIINFRPKSMIEYERSIGFDHGKSGLDNIALSNAEKLRTASSK